LNYVESDQEIICDNGVIIYAGTGTTPKLNCTISSVVHVNHTKYSSYYYYNFDILNITPTGHLIFDPPVSDYTGGGGTNHSVGGRCYCNRYGGGKIYGGFGGNGSSYETPYNGGARGQYGGQYGYADGYGGGSRSVFFNSNLIIINGNISANGGNGLDGAYNGATAAGGGGGGSGDTLTIKTRRIEGNGNIFAIGGNGGKGGFVADAGCRGLLYGGPGGGGSGGKVEIIAETGNFNLANINVTGGIAGQNIMHDGSTCGATNGPNGTKSISIAGTGEAYNYSYTCNDGYDNDMDGLIDYQDDDCQILCPGWTDLSSIFSLVFPTNWFAKPNGYDSCCGDDNYILNGDFER